VQHTDTNSDGHGNHDADRNANGYSKACAYAEASPNTGAAAVRHANWAPSNWEFEITRVLALIVRNVKRYGV
jgi:hypothetical protein